MNYDVGHVAQANGDPQWLQFAVELQESMDELFWDHDDGASYHYILLHVF